MFASVKSKILNKALLMILNSFGSLFAVRTTGLMLPLTPPMSVLALH